ncbi:Tim44/TimA family putative adaptor protein [Pseudoxanthobacter sp.]|uniref:Tim44/TimA family putative adaptor protein n=1 Tax=Pseudoxanthobacter sp. TaxID=1925742 RepID=UPI002FE3655A
MGDFLDIYNIIFLVLAVVIFLRLRSVLGRRTGNEGRPVDPFAKRGPAEAPKSEAEAPRRDLPPVHDNVTPLPTARPAPAANDAGESGVSVLDRVAPEGSPLRDGLKALLAADPSFEPERFVAGARVAYEMIVTAFAAGDRKALKPLLSRDVFEGFSAAIAARESRGESVDFTFVGISRAEIVAAGLRGVTAEVTLRIDSELVSLTRDKDGKVIDGDPTRVSNVVDRWTFARDTDQRDPNWKLVATESAG